MSCGLGAIILVFLLVKHNIDTSRTEEIDVSQIELLLEDLNRLKEEEHVLNQKIADTRTNAQQTTERIQSISDQLADVQRKSAEKVVEIAQLREKLSALKEIIKNTQVAKPSDIVEDAKIGEENYIIGLKVEGKKIGILIDSSASMTDEILINVIRRKNNTDSVKMAGPKWQRTKRIVRWLLARLPKTGMVHVIAYNDRAHSLGSKNWMSGRDANALREVGKDLDKLVPTGATNLQRGLDALALLAPSNIYLITDGLPTKGDSNFGDLNPFASCTSLLGRSNTISGECRLKLFQHTLKTSAPRSNVPVNVILLPIEGDPEASQAYWSWTAFTGGLLISPASNWP